MVGFGVGVISGANGQWQIQDSHSTANLRGVHSVDGMVAWASGASGTVLRTENGGARWEKCAIPAGAEQLDFRGIWAWDANTAMVMSAGPGDQSRIYKTVDGCAHWTEEKRNSEKDGFWDALIFQTQDFGMPGGENTGLLIGDPVRGRFYTEATVSGQNGSIQGWSIDHDSCASRADESAFAASNSSAFLFGSRRYIIGTGGKGGPRILLSPLLAHPQGGKTCLQAAVPLAMGSESAGVFSLAFRDRKHGVAVGGDYKKPAVHLGTAAWTQDGGLHWTAASAPPRGYRSAVAWYPEGKAWIAAGTNGSDFSLDDGKTWQALDDGNWNALSLPFVVGPDGRVGKLRAIPLKP